MRIGIIGAGALGTLFGYRLARSNDVSMLERRPDVVSAVREHGLRSVDGNERRAVTISSSARDLFTSNVLFVFVRATDTMRVLRPFVNELDPSCVIVSLQNGIQNEDAVKAALGSNVALVLGATTESALTLAPGSAAPVGTGTTIVGPGGATPEVCARIARLLTDAGMAASVAYDIRPHLWGKLVANAAINPVAALLDRPNGIILEDTNAGELARSLAQEAATVAGAMRIALPFTDPWSYVRSIAEQTADLRNSMLADLTGGAQTENDHINGAVVAAGRRAAVPTPYNDTIFRLIRAREAVAQK
ncbi:MAG TPA: 2-dehydropantoate 2-reductase [Candidatus Lustribacter sp.]|jgi:2-dehydropantoate 2-reductase|nr:2-dehydropantoate 2-reductase [Candidatus Lustribacter sp.]